MNDKTVLIFKSVFTLQEITSYLNIIKENKAIHKKNKIHFIKKSFSHVRSCRAA